MKTRIYAAPAVKGLGVNYNPLIAKVSDAEAIYIRRLPAALIIISINYNQSYLILKPFMSGD